MASEIRERCLQNKRIELIRRLFDILDNHGGLRLREHPFLRHHPNAPRRSTNDTEMNRINARFRRMQTDDSRRRVRERYEGLNSGQKKFVDEVVSALETRAGTDCCTSTGSLFFCKVMQEPENRTS